MSKNIFYRGDTFKLVATFRGVISGVQSNDFTNYDLRSQIRDPRGDLIADLLCTWIDAEQGIAEISFASSTAGWPLTTAKMNFALTLNGHRASTPPVFFEIEEGPTR